MKTARFLPAQIWTIAQAEEHNTVFIRPEGSNIVLPVYVSENDIQTILVELTHILAPRPNVHELVLAAIEALHGTLERVEIYGIRNGTYLCRIILCQNGKEVRLESRPSDILCLAARVECSVFIDDEILAGNGIPVERIIGKKDLPDGIQEPPTVAGFLQKELQGALEREEYERAVVLRDRLSEISRHDAEVN